ncbi:hypothetical protein H0A66_15160 [Alcaligenaceae bacterium]|nr:hypothetical protein [Alcaligenaceae bacterium]
MTILTFEAYTKAGFKDIEETPLDWQVSGHHNLMLALSAEHWCVMPVCVLCRLLTQWVFAAYWSMRLVRAPKHSMKNLALNFQA